MATGITVKVVDHNLTGTTATLGRSLEAELPNYAGVAVAVVDTAYSKAFRLPVLTYDSARYSGVTIFLYDPAAYGIAAESWEALAMFSWAELSGYSWDDLGV